jgi:hypothetical protein
MNECYPGASQDSKDPRPCEPIECKHKAGLCSLCCGCETDDKKIREALELVLDDLTESNAHTIAALLESQYRTGYDMDKVERAYKAAQWELFGTR